MHSSSTQEHTMTAAHTHPYDTIIAACTPNRRSARSSVRIHLDTRRSGLSPRTCRLWCLLTFPYGSQGGEGGIERADGGGQRRGMQWGGRVEMVEGENLRLTLEGNIGHVPKASDVGLCVAAVSQCSVVLGNQITK